MKKLIGGNWKMECDTCTFKNAGINISKPSDNVDVFIAIPYIYANQFRKYIDENIKMASQNLSKHESGPYTGQVSAKMLKEANFEYALIGHSEVRAEFLETDDEVNLKLKMALENALKPILCIGESLLERRNGKYLHFLAHQFVASIRGLNGVHIDVAYEPVWAIGTEETAKPDDIREVIYMIRDLMNRHQISGRIIYGGSVSKASISQLIKIENCDGFLVGNASLGKEFQYIIDTVSNANF
jgi:triosephosphate isomerase